MKRRRKSPPELDDLIRRARANTARRHHVVPAMYLRNFADDRGLIRVTDHVAGRDFLKKPEKVAHITDFYRMDAPEVQAAGIPPLFAETLLADIERINAPLVRALIHDPADQPRRQGLMSQGRWYVVLFPSQLTRTTMGESG